MACIFVCHNTVIMKTLNKESFDNFYKENASVLSSRSITRHEFKPEIFEKWKNKFKDNLNIQSEMNYTLGDETPNLYLNIQSFLDQFQPQYIKFETFVSTLEKIVNEMFQELVMNKYRPDMLVLLLPERIIKSGLWVSMLAWPFIKEHLKDNDNVDFII